MWSESTGEVNHEKERNLLSHWWHYLGMSCCLIEEGEPWGSWEGNGEGSQDFCMQLFLPAITFERCLSLALIDLLPNFRVFIPTSTQIAVPPTEQGRFPEPWRCSQLREFLIPEASINSVLCAGGSAAGRSSESSWLCSTKVTAAVLNICTAARPQKSQLGKCPASPLGLSLPLPQLSSQNRWLKYCTNGIIRFKMYCRMWLRGFSTAVTGKGSGALQRGVSLMVTLRK